MDNVVHAIFLAFAMFALVIGLSFGLYLIGNMNSVATQLIRAQDYTTNYQSVSYDSKEVSKNGMNTRNTRIVGVDTVISTLYKYYKESFSVEIYDKDKKLNQVFDLTIENIINQKDENNPEYLAYRTLYGDGQNANLYGTPWTSNVEYVKQRIDMYISGKKGYINGVEVDYSKTGLNTLGTKFLEEFIQYTYDGETISDDNGEDIETITGSTRAHTKIIIRYIQIKDEE